MLSELGSEGLGKTDLVLDRHCCRRCYGLVEELLLVVGFDFGVCIKEIGVEVGVCSWFTEEVEFWGLQLFWFVGCLTQAKRTSCGTREFGCLDSSWAATAADFRLWSGAEADFKLRGAPCPWVWTKPNWSEGPKEGSDCGLHISNMLGELGSEGLGKTDL
ncbi:hypothetical protein Droror1_Dr00021734, partial [Drosera rotundifolia]